MRHIMLWVMVLVFGVWSAVASAQVEPADSNIKAVMGDLDRFEKQAEGIQPGKKSAVKRIEKLLKLTEQPAR